MNSTKDAAKAFGARLRDLMIQRGHGSAGSRSGVDVASLAEAASTTYEMARRYAEGIAIPRPDKLAAIADWLSVPPGALAWGDAASGGLLNEKALQLCIEAVIEAQRRTGRTLTTEQSAHLVALLYQETTAGTMPAAASVDLLVKAATT